MTARPTIQTLETPAVAAPAAPGSPDAASTQRAAERALTTFAFLWGFAALFHQAGYPDQAFGFSALLVTLPALWLLAKPSSLPRLATMAALQIVHVLRVGPANVSNHWIFTFFVNATLLASIGYLLARGRGRAVGRAECFRSFAPVARIELLVLYLFAVVHKLNTDFLAPATSCATDHYALIAKHAAFLPTGSVVAYSAIYGTLVVETAIPLLLVFRRTRLFGVLLGAAFHLGLVLNPAHVFFDFTSMLFAMYFLFVPYDFWGALRVLPLRWKAGQWVRSRLDGGKLRVVARRSALVIGVLLITAYLLRLAPNDPLVINALQESVRALFLLYGGAAIAIFLLVARRRNVVGETRGLDRLAPPNALGLALPALVFFNGMNPYLGLKTDSSFSMFSNLRTEGGVTNHLFIPTSLQVATYQDTLVRVIDSSDPALRRMGRGEQLYTAFELRRRASTRPQASVTYEVSGQQVSGQQVSVPRIADVPALATPLSPIERRFLRFRVVEPAGQGTPCRH
jgi:hypothetical protein